MKIRQLDIVTILRGIACFIIITIHAPLPASLINAPVGIAISTIGFIGIYAFFFLSGFILGKRYLENKYTLSGQGILSFYWKRFKKIAPLYWLVLLYIFVNTPISTPDRFTQFIRLFTFTAPEKITLPSGSYLWFISVIVEMYLVAPIGFYLLTLLAKMKLTARFLIFASIFILGGLIRSLLIPFASYEFITESTLTNIYIFALGLTFSSFYKKISVPFPWRLGIIAFIMAAFFISLSNTLSTSNQLTKLAYQTVIIPSLSYILFALILSVFPAKIPVKIYSPIFIFQVIGIFSYEIYLLHQPIFNRLNLPCTFTCTPFMFMANIAIVTVISLLFAAAIRLVIKSVKL